MSVGTYKITKGPRRGVILYTVDAAGRTYNFDTEAAAREFDNSNWPKPLENGFWLTEDHVRFKTNAKHLAVARQKNLKRGRR